MNKKDRLKSAVAEVRSVRESNERKRKEKEMDKWFSMLTMRQLSDFATKIWENLDFKGKAKVYYIE